MLTWIEDSNKYEEIEKAYFGNYEITVIKFYDGTFSAWVKEIGGTLITPTLFKRSYHSYDTMEEVKEVFLEQFKEFLDEKTSYWMNIQHDFWLVTQWLDEEEE